MKSVAILIGSINDRPVIEPAVQVLKKYSIPYTLNVMSAHRTPERVREFVKAARANHVGVFIAAAGKAAHLAGAIAANTTLPVIGIPVKTSALEGLDALLSTVQMPTGIPVATVAIDGAANAAELAAQILSVMDINLANKLAAERTALAEAVIKTDAELTSENQKSGAVVND
jgi:5-(carboxyamino)imidazole ribonucleotide mutase